MKKKILSFVLTLCLVLPCMFLLVACGGSASVSGKTFTYSKVEVTGTLDKNEYNESNRGKTIAFTEDIMTINDGVNSLEVEYKFEEGKVYLKTGDNYSSNPYAELSGGNLIITETINGDTAKIYFKKK